MFFGRNRELKLLEDRYNSGRFEFLPIYGRRRVGKTTLLREFIKGRNGLMFTAKTDNRKANLDALASKVFGAPISTDLETMFGEIERRAASERFVLIIDEYPRLVRRDSGFGDYLQEFIDRIHDDSKLFLILCGSSLSIMEHEVLGYRSPLYGRRTGSLELLPLDVRTSMRMLEGFDRDDAMRIYGMVGGIPLYLRMFDPGMTLAENVCALFLREDSFFRNEHTMVMIEDFDNPLTYYSIISAVASGHANVGEIASCCSLDAPTVTKHLSALMSIGVISKHRPVDNPNGRMTRYSVTDPFFRFQFARILPVIDEVDPEDPGDYLDSILTLFETDMGTVFEEICTDHLKSIHGGSAGVWWGTDRNTKRMEEIDAVITRSIDGRRTGWFAECKYCDSPIGSDVLETLSRRAMLVKGYQDIHLVLYSKSGFTEAVAKREDVEMYTLNDILGCL